MAAHCATRTLQECLLCGSVRCHCVHTCVPHQRFRHSLPSPRRHHVTRVSRHSVTLARSTSHAFLDHIYFWKRIPNRSSSQGSANTRTRIPLPISSPPTWNSSVSAFTHEGTSCRWPLRCPVVDQLVSRRNLHPQLVFLSLGTAAWVARLLERIRVPLSLALVTPSLSLSLSLCLTAPRWSAPPQPFRA